MRLKSSGMRRECNDGAHSSDGGAPTPTGSRQTSPTVAERIVRQRSRDGGAGSDASPPPPPPPRNIERVLYGNFDIKTWYYSPYPLEPDDDAELSAKAIGKKRNLSPSPMRVNSLLKRSKKDHVHQQHPLATEASAASASSSRRDAVLKSATSAALDSTSASPRASPSAPRKKEVPPPLRMLWVCEGCFKYMKTYNAFAVHKKLCPHTHPPGRKLYQRGAHIIWEVDGAEQKLYCQNLSLFGKLFIDHKTIYFDVEPFLFYILTDASASFDHPLGFFSKEKNSYDDYNLACIITFPPFQRKSFGTLMIEFSYFLSARQGMLGTPERPLSDLGHRGYLAFWSSVVLRALLFCFDGSTLAKPVSGRGRRPSSALSSSAPISDGGNARPDSPEAQQEAARKLKMLKMRCKLLGLPYSAIEQQGLHEIREAAGSPKKEKKIRLKGWAGSTPVRSPRILLRRSSSTSVQAADDNQRDQSPSHGVRNIDGRMLRATRAPSMAKAECGKPAQPALTLKLLDQSFSLVTTLEAISNVTHLRTDDIAQALIETGLLAADAPFLAIDDPLIPMSTTADAAMQKPSMKRSLHQQQQHNFEQQYALLLTKEAVLEAVKRLNVRAAVLDEAYILI